jgi:hypothetical protein
MPKFNPVTLNAAIPEVGELASKDPESTAVSYEKAEGAVPRTLLSCTARWMPLLPAPYPPARQRTIVPVVQLVVAQTTALVAVPMNAEGVRSSVTPKLRPSNVKSELPDVGAFSPRMSEDKTGAS